MSSFDRDPSGAAKSRASETATDHDAPGVPRFRTWRGVYWFVFGCFAAMVIALTLFTRFYA